MLKKAFLPLIVCSFLILCLSCDDGSLIFMNELSEAIHGGGGGGGETTIINVKADSVGKAYRTGVPFPDPELTYKYDPDPLPKGVSFTGELERDPGELAGTYVIRQGTLELTGINASKYTLNFIVNVFYISD